MNWVSLIKHRLNNKFYPIDRSGRDPGGWGAQRPSELQTAEEKVQRGLFSWQQQWAQQLPGEQHRGSFTAATVTITAATV